VEGSGETRSRSPQARYLKPRYSLGIGGGQVVDAVIIILMLLSGLLGRLQVEFGAALIFLGLHVSLHSHSHTNHGHVINRFSALHELT